MAWETIRHERTHHVAMVPLDDLMEHARLSHLCPCGPKTEWHNDWLLVTHASLDGRELLER